MRSLIILFTLLFTCSAQAKDLVITLPCDTAISVFDILKEENERLHFIGNTAVRETTTGRFYKAGMYIWINLEEQTSSVTILFPDMTMCLLASANSFDTYSGSQPWEKKKDEL